MKINEDKKRMLDEVAVDRVDELISGYADKLQQVYDGGTAGDYTFVGILSKFTRALSEVKDLL